MKTTVPLVMITGPMLYWSALSVMGTQYWSNMVRYADTIMKAYTPSRECLE